MGVLLYLRSRPPSLPSPRSQLPVLSSPCVKYGGPTYLPSRSGASRASSRVRLHSSKLLRVSAKLAFWKAAAGSKQQRASTKAQVPRRKYQAASSKQQGARSKEQAASIKVSPGPLAFGPLPRLFARAICTHDFRFRLAEKRSDWKDCCAKEQMILDQQTARIRKQGVDNGEFILKDGGFYTRPRSCT